MKPLSGRRILAIDDDPTMLALVTHLLSGAGFEVEVAADGDTGLRCIKEAPPELVVCDVQMPGLDGFQVLDRVRGNAGTSTLPFVLLTALNDRESVRRGMRLGADDFLSKPVQPNELIEAVNVALDKRLRMSSVVSGHALPVPSELRDHYASRFEGAEPRPASEPDLAGMTGRRVTQTVLFTDIRGFTTMSERLPVTDIAELLTRYLKEACKPILEHRGRIMKIMGDGVMALFGHESPEDARGHASAALRAGLQIVQVAQQFRHWVATRFDSTMLPPFDVGVGIHTGEVMLFQLSVGGSRDLTAVGDTVNVASRLEAKSKELGWPIVASEATLRHAGPAFSVAESREIDLPGREARIKVGRLVAPTGVFAALPDTSLSFGVRAVLQESARSTAEAAKQALDGTLHAIGEHNRPGASKGEGELLIHGYRVLAKIGQGGMSSVYLAEEQGRGRRNVVLKVLKGRRGDDDGLWKRFFQECAILSSIDHEHVVRIYDQGFGEELAYIAMEHLSGGSLRQLIDRGLTPRQALSLLSQAASGLGEIHRRGIVHRDIKPANLMLRDAGVLVLTDFGVAKRLDQSVNQTIQGEILGTPYYISPEQADGGEITPASDFYSLGIIFYEMLTGQRPYAGATILEILSQHVAAPVPHLPAELAQYQGLIDGMLAKRREARFQNAEAVLAAIDDLWTQIALRKDVCTT